MQSECVETRSAIDVCSQYLEKYYASTDKLEKKRYYNILYALISCEVTNSSILDYKDFYNWCNEDVTTNQILELCVNNTLEVKSKNFTIVQAINNIEKEIQNLKILMQRSV